MYKLILTKSFQKRVNKLIKKDPKLEAKLEEKFKVMSKDPFDRVLMSHKVQSRDYGLAWSSRITGDVRLIWDFADSRIMILLLDIGGHSGSRDVYK